MKKERGIWHYAGSHFIIVGVVFGLVLGLLASNLAWYGIDAGMESMLGLPARKFYYGRVLLTVVSMVIVAVCIWIGNRVFQLRWSAGFVIKHLRLSVLLFALMVLITEGAEMAAIFAVAIRDPERARRVTSLLLTMLSLPLFRLIVLPAIYYFIGKKRLLENSKKDSAFQHRVESAQKNAE